MMKKIGFLFVIAALLVQSFARPDATAVAGTAVTDASKAAEVGVKTAAAVPSSAGAASIASVANKAESVPAQFGINSFVRTGLNTAGKLYNAGNSLFSGLFGISK